MIFDVVIVGRPNVGKSRLFNRLVGSNQAIVLDTPGVTRDWNEGRVDSWKDGQPVSLTLVDTGGVGGPSFTQQIDEQVENAVRRAAQVLFVVDGPAGILPEDEEVLRSLRRWGCTPVLVVNKLDVEGHDEHLAEFHALGVETVFGLSAEHNRGVAELKDWLFERISHVQEKGLHLPRIALVGKPNVGKSTFLNALLARDRSITSPQAGTTVDVVESEVAMGDHHYLFLDTAGVRKKSKTEAGVEVLSVVKTRQALEKADLALLMIDGEGGSTDQDEKIAGLIQEAGCSVVIIVNKWDLQKRNAEFTQKDAVEFIQKKMAFLKYAPIMFVSALKKWGFRDLGNLIEDVLESRNRKIGTKELTELVRREVEVHNPKQARFFYSHQTSRRPPTFVCHVNSVKKVDFSLKRHIVNSLRDQYGFVGAPIRLVLRETQSTK